MRLSRSDRRTCRHPGCLTLSVTSTRAKNGRLSVKGDIEPDRRRRGPRLFKWQRRMHISHMAAPESRGALMECLADDGDDNGPLEPSGAAAMDVDVHVVSDDEGDGLETILLLFPLNDTKTKRGCLLCPTTFVCDSGRDERTSKYWEHLDLKHAAVLKAVTKREATKQARASAKRSKSLKGAPKGSTDDIRAAIVGMVVEGNFSFKLATSPLFKEFIAVVGGPEAAACAMGRAALNTQLNGLMEAALKAVASMFTSCAAVSIAFDGWTSLANTNYLLISATFLLPHDGEYKLRTVRVAASAISGAGAPAADGPAAVVYSEAISRALTRAGISPTSRKLICATTDNTSLMPAICKAMSLRRVACGNHVLQLVLKAALGASGPVAALAIKIRFLCAFLKKSPNRTQEFHEIQRTLHIEAKGTGRAPALGLVRPVITRWSSYTEAFVRACSLRVAITRFAAQTAEALSAKTLKLTPKVATNFHKCRLSAVEWETMEALLPVLKAFNETVKGLQAENVIQPAAGVMALLRLSCGLFPTFPNEALHDGSRSTRVELDDANLVAVVNDVHYDFAFDPSDISTLWLSVSPRLVVSVRLQPLRSIDRLRDAVRRGASLRSTVELLVHLMHDQGDVLVNIVRGSTKRVDDIEDHLLAGRLETRRADLGSLRRLLVRLQRVLAPEPAALFRLLQKPPAWIGEEDRQDLRQSTEEFNLALSDMAALQERIKLLQEEIEGRVAEQNNRSLFVLTVVTVLALPINIIAGLFGMNVGGVPLAEHKHGFWIVVAIIVTFTVIAGWFAFHKKRD